MPHGVEWTAAMDVALIALRRAGFSWLEIARTLGVGHVRARGRAIALGILTQHISSGRLTGVAIAAGARPKTRWVRGRRWLGLSRNGTVYTNP